MYSVSICFGFTSKQSIHVIEDFNLKLILRNNVIWGILY